MGCPGLAILGQNITFWVDTHDPDTGVSTDADAVASYRIYEDDTGTPILTGNMALNDDANTTGNYVKTIAVTTANGFEVFKSYGVRCQATVDSDTGALTMGFYVLPDLWNKDSNETYNATTDSLEALRDILIQNAVAGATAAGELTVIRGDTYDSDADNAITALGDISTRTKLWIVVKKSANQTDAQSTLYVEETAGITRLNGSAYGTAAHSVITVSDASAGDLRWQLDEAVTDDLTRGLYHYDIQTLDASGNVKTWRRMNQFTVTADVARVIS